MTECKYILSVGRWWSWGRRFKIDRSYYFLLSKWEWREDE